ncbi:MAG: dockerin type I repeat-containing protein [Ruminococcus sp.]|nr:dockerin type I repeat-containing protein [Ruminococcus sp.]
MKKTKKTMLTAVTLLSAMNLVPANVLNAAGIEVEEDDSSVESEFVNEMSGVYGPPPIVGDLNYDRSVDAFDMQLMRKAIVNGGGKKYAHVYDLNDDNNTDMSDAVILQKYILGMINEYDDIITTSPIQTTVTTTTREILTTQPAYGPPVYTTGTEVTTIPAPLYGPPEYFSSLEAAKTTTEVDETTTTTTTTIYPSYGVYGPPPTYFGY